MVRHPVLGEGEVAVKGVSSVGANSTSMSKYSPVLATVRIRPCRTQPDTQETMAGRSQSWETIVPLFIIGLVEPAGCRVTQLGNMAQRSACMVYAHRDSPEVLTS